MPSRPPAIATLRAQLAALAARERVARPRPPISAAALARVERALGRALPAGYRAYVRGVSDGGPGLDDELDGGIARVATLTRAQLARARRPFPFVRAWRGRPALAEGTAADDGTLTLGTLTGTHVRYLLVVSGPRAGEVWIDATAEGSTLAPASPAAFLALQQRYLAAADASAYERAILDGTAIARLRKARDAARQELRWELASAAHELLPRRELDVTQCRRLAAVCEALDDPMAAQVALLRAGDMEAVARHAVPALKAAVKKRSALAESIAMHVLIAAVALDRLLVDSLTIPHSPAEYYPTYGDRARELLRPVLARLTPAQRAQVAQFAGPRWKPFVLRSTR